MLTDEKLKQIASDGSHHVCESGAPNAKQHNACVVEQAIRRAVDLLVEHFIDRAQCAADNMEGASANDFIRFETRMICATETLEYLGVKFNPITGDRKSL